MIGYTEVTPESLFLDRRPNYSILMRRRKEKTSQTSIGIKIRSFHSAVHLCLHYVAEWRREKDFYMVNK